MGTESNQTNGTVTKASEAKLAPANQHSTCSSDLPYASSHQLHKLQRTFGNRALGRVIQAKLKVSQPGDAYEQDADRVADEVMRMPDPQAPSLAGERTIPGPTPTVLARPEKGVARKMIEGGDEPVEIAEGEPAEVSAVEPTEPAEPVEPAQKCDCQEEEEHASKEAIVQRSADSAAHDPRLEPDVGNRIQAMLNGGRPMTSSERGFMEPRFGVDFSAIRVHESQEADKHSRSLQARAFTLGSDIFFRAGEYSSGEAKGNHLLAHELAHTIQQGAASRLNGPHLGNSAGTLQRQAPPAPAPPAPAPPAPAPVVVPAGRATVNHLSIINDLVPPGWGITAPSWTVLDITAYADGATWKCVITQADEQTHQGVRLLPGVVEVTPALVAAEARCPTLDTMITSLGTVANQGADSGFYMISAVQAHESLHVTQGRTGVAGHYVTAKAAIEALTPLSSHANAAAAKAAIKALPAYTAATATFRAGETAVYNATASHTGMASFIAVEHGVVDPMIASIRARKTAIPCPP